MNGNRCLVERKERLRRPRHATLAAAALLACWCAAGPAWGACREVWVTTDRTVDCSSLETIVRDVIKPGMNNEQKAIALFEFYRHLVFHHYNTRDSRHPIKLFNILGYTLCGSQGTTFCALARKAGFEARVVSVPGHTFSEVKYDGRWHAFDTFMNFYVWTRGENRHIADLDELKKDPSLATKAEAEGRACPGFLMCGDGPKLFTRGRRILNYKPQTTPYSPKRLNLYRGMVFIRYWDCNGKPSPRSWNRKFPDGPHHTCGGKDRRSIENFHNWEPYLRTDIGRVSRSYRHWASGRVNYAPDLRAGDWRDSALVAENLDSGKNEEEPALHPVKAGAPAKWAFEIYVPYYITEGRLEVAGRRKSAADMLKAEVSVDGGKKWLPVWTARKTGRVAGQVNLARQIVRACPGRFSYRVRFVMQAAEKPTDVGLDAFYLRTVFQHNMMATPILYPGQNKVKIEAVPSDTAPDAPFPSFQVVYRWKTGPKGVGPVREVKWDVVKSPAEFEVKLPKLPGKKQHKMLSLEYRCGKLVRPGSKPLILADFAAHPDAVKKWRADKSFTVSHDGKGLLLKTKGEYFPQLYLGDLKLDLTKYRTFAVDIENLSNGAQIVKLRLRSNGNRKQYSEVERLVPAKQRVLLTAPLSAFIKTKLDAVDRVYLQFVKPPKDGRDFRIYSVRFSSAEEGD